MENLTKKQKSNYSEMIYIMSAAFSFMLACDTDHKKEIESLLLCLNLIKSKLQFEFITIEDFKNDFRYLNKLIENL